MACPYFIPEAPCGRGQDPRAAMLPLGDEWSGLCRASGVREPAEAGALRLCNLGYARGECPRFPGGDGPDAVRFAIRAVEPARLCIQYVMERDHHPHAYGCIDCSRDTGAALRPPEDEALLHQAAAYAQSYLKRTASR
jgi:hypothetical protein